MKMKTAAIVISILVSIAPSIRAQTLPAPLSDPFASGHEPRPIPGPIFESNHFSRAVARGTRTRTGAPGANYWVQHPSYEIHAALDPVAHRVTGKERITYRNFSPDTLRTIETYLRQNAFAAGSPRRQSVPETDGVTLESVLVDGTAIHAEADRNPAMPVTAAPARRPTPGEYAVDGTVMSIPLATPLVPGATVALDIAWSYTPAPAPADGREGRDGNVYFMGYWYPEVAVYDDVDGWVTDPYLMEAEFYMDPADYDVDVGVPNGWVVGATGSLVNATAVLSKAARDSLAVARRTGRTVRIASPGEDPRAVFASTNGSTTNWHFVAKNVRDFAWGTSNEYAWDATRALVRNDAGGRDTVDINSFYRLTPDAAAWAVGGARYTRDAIEQMSNWLWRYPWTQMTSMEGILDSGGMEYPMMTLMQPWADTLSLAGDLMHETGHMWFPMQVGSNETRNPWMDEGFTQFDVAQAMGALYGENRSGGRANDSEHGQRRLYLGTVRRGEDDELMRPGDLFPDNTYLVVYYDKTAQVLSALRGILGGDVLHQALISYGKEWIGKHPQPYDFFNALSHAAGQDLSWFWNTWFYHAWPLDQAIDNVGTAGDSLVVTIGDHGLAPMPVFLAVTHRDSSVTRVTIPVDVWLSGKRQTTVMLPGASTITAVTIDPDGFFPDVDRSNQSRNAANGWQRP
jgi:hypothetical protein